jgi:hypothetical protein
MSKGKARARQRYKEYKIERELHIKGVAKKRFAKSPVMLRSVRGPIGGKEFGVLMSTPYRIILFRIQ